MDANGMVDELMAQVDAQALTVYIER